MIRLGQVLVRPVSRRRTPAYMRRRRRSAPRKSPAPERAAATEIVKDESMIFDQPPAELPVATLVPREHQTRWRADLMTWLAAKWRWFKPRTVPMVVAFIGMLAVIGSATYLRNYARRTPARPAQVTTITVDGQPAAGLAAVAVTPSRCALRAD